MRTRFNPSKENTAVLTTTVGASPMYADVFQPLKGKHGRSDVSAELPEMVGDLLFQPLKGKHGRSDTGSEYF